MVWGDHQWGFGNDWDIYGRLPAADGAPLRAAFGIGFAGEKHRLAPTVAYNPQVDEFLVVYEYSTTDYDLYARRVSTAGALVGDEISLVAPGDLNALPALAYNPTDNEYLLVRQRYVANPTVHWDVSGIALALGTTSQSAPALAYGALNDEYLVAWEQPGATARPMRVPTSTLREPTFRCFPGWFRRVNRSTTATRFRPSECGFSAEASSTHRAT